MNINEKLLMIQNELKAPKNQFNKFGNYKYRSCEDILEGVKPICKKYKAVLTVSDEIVQIGDRYYVRALAKLSDTESDESVYSEAFARESLDKKGMDSSQVTGATSSYARKYALNGLFCIDDTKDFDTEEANKQSQKNDNMANLIKRYTELRRELEEVGCDFRDEKVDKYITDKAKVNTQNLNLLDEKGLERINKVYETMLKAKNGKANQTK